MQTRSVICWKSFQWNVSCIRGQVSVSLRTFLLWYSVKPGRSGGLRRDEPRTRLWCFGLHQMEQIYNNQKAFSCSAKETDTLSPPSFLTRDCSRKFTYPLLAESLGLQLAAHRASQTLNLSQETKGLCISSFISLLHILLLCVCVYDSGEMMKLFHKLAWTDRTCAE